MVVRASAKRDLLDDQKNSLLDQSTPRVQERFPRPDKENLLIEQEIVRDETTNASVDLAMNG